MILESNSKKMIKMDRISLGIPGFPLRNDLSPNYFKCIGNIEEIPLYLTHNHAGIYALFLSRSAGDITLHQNPPHTGMFSDTTVEFPESISYESLSKNEVDWIPGPGHIIKNKCIFLHINEDHRILVNKKVIFTFKKMMHIQ